MKSEAHPVTDSVLVALRRIARTIDLRSRDLMHRYGLTVPQLVVLREIERRGRHTGGSLAEEVNLSRPTVTGILKRLESRDLVKRRRSDTDRRQVVVELTPLGRRLVDTAPSPLQSSFRRRFEDLADWEQAMILSSLQRLVEMMEAGDLDAAPYLATGAADAPPAGDAASAVAEDTGALEEVRFQTDSPAEC